MIALGTNNGGLKPVSGRVTFILIHNETSLVGKTVQVGSSGKFTTTLNPGKWSVGGSSPHYVQTDGTRGTCRGPDVTVTAGSTANVTVECITL